jgi:hypothetical protein
LAHKDCRLDIVKFYVEGFHERILLALRNYFKKTRNALENRDIFELVKFLVWYRGNLKVFGEAFDDKRVIDGITVLCRIVGRRLLKNNMKSVETIIRSVRKLFYKIKILRN